MFLSWLAPVTQLYVSLLASTTLSSLRSIPQHVGAVNVTVSLNYSTYVGTAQTGTGVTQWLGIRYAKPPLGDLRFMPPQDPVVNTTTQLADQHGKYCLATDGAADDTATSEDCLFLDVYAPSNATTSSNLPVYFYIQGGGFNTNSNPNLNGTGLVQASGYNIIVITINYRVGPYGFLANGQDVQGNHGLLDQRLALSWVQKYVKQFGGDPSHVVLGGDSAGAASISLHLTAYGGRDDGLFQAAAGECVSFAAVLTSEESKYQYDNLALRLGCVGNSSQTLACLQNKTSEELQDVNYNIPYPGAAARPLFMYNPVIDGDLIRNLTYNSFANGDFIKIPVIYGDDTNGGTIFTPSNTSTIEESDMFLKNQFPNLTLEHFATINDLYPNPNQTCPSEGCYWRQVSNAYGEGRYMCPGLYLNKIMTEYGVDSSWAYRWNVEDPAQMADGEGVPHTVEINAIFGPYNTNGAAPSSYYPNGTNAHAVPVVQGYWTSFIRTYNPNTYRLNGSAEWVTWNSTDKGRLLFDTGGVTSMEDLAGSDLMDRCNFWYDVGPEILQKR